MFTKTELLQQYQTITLKPLSFLRVEPHSCSGQESSCYVYRGSAAHFDSPMQFYCNCLIEWDARGQDYNTWKDSWWGWLPEEVSPAVCLSIAKYEFSERMGRLLFEVKDSVQLPDTNEFVAALQMEDEWNDVGVLAEFKNEFIYANWHTTG